MGDLDFYIRDSLIGSAQIFLACHFHDENPASYVTKTN